jgi:hypothetical protein
MLANSAVVSRGFDASDLLRRVNLPVKQRPRARRGRQGAMHAAEILVVHEEFGLQHVQAVELGEQVRRRHRRGAQRIVRVLRLPGGEGPARRVEFQVVHLVIARLERGLWRRQTVGSGRARRRQQQAHRHRDGHPAQRAPVLAPAPRDGLLPMMWNAPLLLLRSGAGAVLPRPARAQSVRFRCFHPPPCRTAPREPGTGVASVPPVFPVSNAR